MENVENSSAIEHLTDLIECKSILTAIDGFGLFRIAKRGFMRLIKDNRKRLHAVELFNYEKTAAEKNKSTLKPLYSFEVMCMKVKRRIKKNKYSSNGCVREKGVKKRNNLAMQAGEVDVETKRNHGRRCSNHSTVGSEESGLSLSKNYKRF